MRHKLLAMSLAGVMVVASVCGYGALKAQASSIKELAGQCNKVGRVDYDDDDYDLDDRYDDDYDLDDRYDDDDRDIIKTADLVIKNKSGKDIKEMYVKDDRDQWSQESLTKDHTLKAGDSITVKDGITYDDYDVEVDLMFVDSDGTSVTLDDLETFKTTDDKSKITLTITNDQDNYHVTMQ